MLNEALFLECLNIKRYWINLNKLYTKFIFKDNKPSELEEKWQIVHYEKSGSKRSSSLGVVDEIVGNKWVRPKRRTSVDTLKLNRQSIPKEVDLSTQRLRNKPQKGIYKVENEKLFFFYAYDQKLSRPKGFTTEEVDNCHFYRLKKIGNWLIEQIFFCQMKHLLLKTNAVMLFVACSFIYSSRRTVFFQANGKPLSLQMFPGKNPLSWGLRQGTKPAPR